MTVPLSACLFHLVEEIFKIYFILIKTTHRWLPVLYNNGYMFMATILLILFVTIFP